MSMPQIREPRSPAARAEHASVGNHGEVPISEPTSQPSQTSALPASVAGATQTGSSDLSTRSGGRSGRILGIDVARALAIIGMVMVHVGPVRIAEPDLGEQIYALAHGRASVLFVLLAGLGVTLLAGDRSAQRRRRMWGRLLWQAAVLLPLGLALQLLDHGVLVILQYYAVYFLLAGVAVHLSGRVLLGGALGGVALAPVASLALFHWRPSAFDTSATEWGDPALLIARQLLVTGSYPALVWGVPVLFGVWLGRRDLMAAAVRWRLLAVGIVLAVGAALASTALVGAVGEVTTEPSWRQLATDAPHSEMPLWLLGSLGSAMAVLGASLLLAGWLPRLLWPVAAMGQLAFTVYVGHLFVLDLATDVLRRDEVGPAALSVVRFTLVTVVLAALWRWRLARGPLEALMRAPWAVHDRLR